jgi:hypothetical protein
MHKSHRGSHKDWSGWVTWTDTLHTCVSEESGDGESVVSKRYLLSDTLLCMCERGAWERGGCGLASTIIFLIIVEKRDLLV